MMTALLRGGRVVDPANGTDGQADVLVQGSSVVAIAPALSVPPGCAVVDVTGLIVGPGFVDLHSHVHSVAGHRLQALDGVTTALDLEAGLMPLDKAYKSAAAEGRPLNYGFSASWGAARGKVLSGVEPDASIASGLALLSDHAWQQTSSPAQLRSWLALLEGEVAAGALGIGVLLGYAPASAPREFRAVADLAAEAGVPTFTHVRELVEVDPLTPVDGSGEIALVAAETGAAMHHCHVNSTSRRHVDRVLGMLDSARRAGSRITVEAYPYGSGSTAVGASFLAPERLAAWGLTPSSVVLLETQERIANLGRLEQVRAADPAAPCVVEFLDEEDPRDRAFLQQALAFPEAVVASDAMPLVIPVGEEGWDRYSWPLPASVMTHPRTAGTFAKTLRLMVLETGTWTWLEAFRRCSFLPARILDAVAPAARRKGRLEPGADADIVVLDPAVVTDAATPFEPTRSSRGVRHLLVGGQFVVRDGRLRLDAFPGRPVRGVPR